MGSTPPLRRKYLLIGEVSEIFESMIMKALPYKIECDITMGYGNAALLAHALALLRCTHDSPPPPPATLPHQSSPDPLPQTPGERSRKTGFASCQTTTILSASYTSRTTAR